ncbi:hypothetical protein RhiirA4_482518 [Rhizophagus irregularis]|uniref:Uncharacterized protein n=1 Tax=Rhizophagus irregularis TaxID=588596 RepID=A0A2I1HL98_9GLOM|nr:hypothetical protein RhiirA4_482518 [Rhizophagus irregularis]
MSFSKPITFPPSENPLLVSLKTFHSGRSTKLDVQEVSSLTNTPITNTKLVPDSHFFSL